MKAALRVVSVTSRNFRLNGPPSRSYATIQRVPAIDASFNEVELQLFQEAAFIKQKPLLLKAYGASGSSALPAATKWFQAPKHLTDQDAHQVGFSKYLESFATTKFPYELIYPQRLVDAAGGTEAVSQFCTWLSSSKDQLLRALGSFLLHHLPSNSTQVQFVRFNAPLALFIAALRFNETQSGTLTQLYIAQAALSELPSDLKEDVATPFLVQRAGKGDVYDSSVWIGLEPTYTAWHRDPNPNLFCQLCSSKLIRLAPPTAGDAIFRSVQMQLGRQGSSRIRGEEMMQGAERKALHEAIWESESHPDLLETQVEPGDALFIPKGWWHSVKSAFSDGRLNGSVNWWFR